jgi:hypothetical protein
MHMKYGQIAEGNAVNKKIYMCFDYLCEDDKRKFVKKFRDQPHDNEQIMDTFRELILGAYLSSKGLKVRYDYQLHGKTPDWCVIDDNDSLKCVIEMVNFHIDKTTDNEIKSHINNRGIWVGWLKPNIERIYMNLLRKTDKYVVIVTEQNVPYVVSLFGDFKAAVEIDEVNRCLFEEHGGLFNDHPILSGVLFFEDAGGDRYKFKYIPNPKTIRKIDLASGEF